MDPEREIHRRVNERYLLTTGDQWANHHDPLHHHDVERLRQLLAAADEAMAAERIDAEVRDRVMYRLLYGDAPAGYEAPDWRPAVERAVDRDLQARRLAETATVKPVVLPPELFGEVSG